MPPTIKRTFFVTPTINDKLIVIPNNIYNDAVSYFPKELVDDIFVMTEGIHTGVVATCNPYREHKYNIDAKLSLIEKHNRAKINILWTYVPAVLFAGYILFQFVTSTIQPYLTISIGLTALFITLYIFMVIQFGLEKVKYGIATLSSIQYLTQIGIKQELVFEYQMAAALSKEQCELANIDAEEIRTRYESALDYFQKRTPNITDEYISTMSSKPIYLIQSEVIQ